MSAAARLQRVIRRHGRTFTLRLVTQGNYDPATGRNAPAVNADYPGTYGMLLAGGEMQVPGGLVTVSKPSVVFAYPDLPAVGGATVQPTTRSRVIDGPKAYQISDVNVPEAEGGPVAAICTLAGT